MRALLQNPKVGGAVAAVALVVAVVVLMMRGEEKPYGPDRSVLWYYDLNTKQSFAVPANDSDFAPIEAPSGPLKEDAGPLKAGEPAGVRLFRFGCGGCTGEVFDAYLTTFSHEINQKHNAGEATDEEIQQQQYRPIDGDAWFSKFSEERKDMDKALGKRCSGKGRVTQCEASEEPEKLKKQ